MLIGEVLLHRTSGPHVEAVYTGFIERWPDADTLASADENDLAAALRPLGLAKRTGIIGRLGRELAALGSVPLTPQALVRLPGVGRYTAHAVPIFAANRNLPLADWVIARVLRRYFGLQGTGRPNHDEELWGLASDIARVGRAREIWLGTLDLAAAYCRPKPKCDECPLRKTCALANRVGD